MDSHAIHQYFKAVILVLSFLSVLLWLLWIILSIWTLIDRKRERQAVMQRKQRQAKRDAEAILTADPALLYVCGQCTAEQPGMMDRCSYCGGLSTVHALHRTKAYVCWPWRLERGERVWEVPFIDTAQVRTAYDTGVSGLDVAGPFGTLEAAQATLERPGLFRDPADAEHYAKSFDRQLAENFGG